jgi:hypothetical protein
MSQEVEKKIQFFVNKIDNGSFYITEILQNRTDNTWHGLKNSSDVQTTYDSAGAGKYIVIVIFFYALVIVFFIATQVKSGKKVSDEVDEVNAEKILRSMQTEIFTREVLGI